MDVIEKFKKHIEKEVRQKKVKYTNEILKEMKDRHQKEKKKELEYLQARLVILLQDIKNYE